MRRRGQAATYAWAAVLVLALALTACGRKGDLRPPPGEEEHYTYPQVYPAPDSVVPGGEATEESPESATEGEETAAP